MRYSRPGPGQPRHRLPALVLTVATVLALYPASLGAPAPVVAATVPLPHVAMALAVSPVAATAGTTVTLSGSGFVPSVTGIFTPSVSFAFTDTTGVRTTLPQTATPTTTGSFTVQVAVPITAATGPALFAATSVSGTMATAAFDVRPTRTQIGASPPSGLPGSTTSITGSGFAAGQPITLTYTQGSYATTLATSTLTTTATGLFTATAPISGGLPAGTGTFMAQDHDGNSATAPFTITRDSAPTVAITPTLTTPGASVTVTGTGFAASQPLTLTFGEGMTATTIVSGTVSTNALGTFTATASIPATAITGTATITATDASSNTAAGSVGIVFPYDTRNGPTSLYFAEGYTGQASTNGKASYTETLSLLNANPFTTTAVITYLVQGGGPVVITRSIPPSSTVRESVNADIGPDKIAAAIVSSPSRLTAQRTIARSAANGATLDADSSLGNPNLGKTFYFAEGYTGITFQEYLTLANPGNTDAHVTLTFAPQTNAITSTFSETLTIPPMGRLTRNIRADTLAFANKSLGMIVTSDAPIMAERVLYFGDGAGSGKFGATTKAGLQTVANQYLFAYGSAGGNGLTQQPGDQSFVTMLNPGASPVSSTVVAQFFDAAGHALGTAAVTVAPGTRQTINANAAVENTSGIYSTVLTSQTPFVAEKPQYYGGSPNAGSHPGIAPSGAPAGVRSVAFPDLGLTDAAGHQQQQTVFLYNPTTAPITVTARYLTANGSASGKTIDYRVAANGITTVNVTTDAGGLPVGALGATFTVTSAGAGDSFVATAIGNTADGRSYTGSQGELSAQ